MSLDSNPTVLSALERPKQRSLFFKAIILILKDHAWRNQKQRFRFALGVDRNIASTAGL
jgi:hypothetical protein